MDKTGFIGELLRTRGSVNLFTRPGRFGKSLNMDMLRCFFEVGTDPLLFEGLEIAKDTELCKQHLGKYPVLSLSLKDAGGVSYEDALRKLCRRYYALRERLRKEEFVKSLLWDKTCRGLFYAVRQTGFI